MLSVVIFSIGIWHQAYFVLQLNGIVLNLSRSVCVYYRYPIRVKVPDFVNFLLCLRIFTNCYNRSTYLLLTILFKCSFNSLIYS